MVERQDIDALLISALYGELTPADEARLATHLESHPADRSALDDLTRAREVVHQSRILTFQYEPPQSISALLIQEASRRAPKKVTEGEGWFARFVRSFIQHPAMAAAAMIMVVVGASALVSRNSNQQFAETPPVETRTNQSETTIAMEAPAAATPPAMEPAAAPTAGADQYKVDLADGELANDALKNKGEGKASPERDPNAAFYESSADRKKGDALGTKSAGKADMGLELRRQQPMPKDFDDVTAKVEPRPDPKPPEEKERLAKQAESQRWTEEAGAPDDGARNREQAGYVADGRTGNARASGNGGGAPAPGTAAAPTTPAPPSSTTVGQAQGPRNAAPPRVTPAPPPAPPSKATTARQEIATDAPTTGSAARDAQKSKEKADKAPNDPNLAWAKDQHAALVTAVRANNCGRAANIALSIANRAPAYYAQNVETDRSVKECIAYINNEREKDAEVRASRAKKSQLKAAEPSAPKRAADQPSRPTSVDSAK